MNTPWRDSKWLIGAMFAAVGFGILVLTIGSIDRQMAAPPREQQPESRLPSNAASGTRLPEGPEALADSASQAGGEAILDSDSPQERIRKRYGMVKIAGVWLPASPKPNAVSPGGAGSADGDEEGASYSLPLYITTGKLPEGRLGERYQARIEAVGGVPPYAWSIERGGAPDTVTLDRVSGELSGTPSKADTRTVRVRVTDAMGAADIAEYKVRITDATGDGSIATAVQGLILPGTTIATSTSSSTASSSTSTAPSSSDAPPADATAPSTEPESPTEPETTPVPLIIMPMTMTDAEAGTAYSAQFTASGGTPPYAWSSLGPLPVGLTLTPAGILSGTPQEPGDFILNFAVMDQAARSTAQFFALRVMPAAPDAVAGFTAFISLRKVSFSWANPADPSVVAVRIVRNPLNPPAHELDGVIIHEGQSTSALDAAPPSGGSYYAAFTLSADGVASEPAPLAVTLNASADPFADAVVDRSLLHAQAFNASLLPHIVLGSPRGGGIGSGSTDVVSLGAASVDEAGAAPYGGSLVISFDNNLAYDGPGADFTIFENVFYIRGATGYDPNSRMMEPAIVSVSQDGVTWHTFPFDFSPRYDATTGALNLRHPFVYNKGFAGVNPVIANGYNVDPTDPTVSGGDSFDLSDLHVPGLDWIRYVRLQSTGDNWLTDSDGELVRHSNTTAFKEATRTSTTSGFDLDAVTAIWLDAVRQ